MSQAAAQLRAVADAAYAAINAGDLDAFLAVTTDDVEFTSLVAEAEGATFHGHDGARDWWETIRGVFQEVHWEVLDMQGSGNRGVACVRLAGTISDVPLEQTVWQAVRMRAGKASWWAFFRTEREALAAVGLAD
jgi:ketosteroid isomerase-like protein